MRAFYSLVLLLILCLVSVASYSDIKYDTNPVVSPGNRYVAFERHYPGYRFTEIVVVDIQTKSSKTIAGQLFDLVWKDQLLLAAAGLTNVSIMRPNGQVVHSAWRTGDGFRAVPMEWQQVGSLNWVKDGVTFTAQDLNGTLRAWYMSSLTGRLENMIDVNPVPIRRRNTT